MCGVSLCFFCCVVFLKRWERKAGIAEIRGERSEVRGEKTGVKSEAVHFLVVLFLRVWHSKKKNGENLIGARKERKLKEQEASTNELMSKRRSRRRGCNPNTTSTKQPPQHRINQLTVSFHSSVVFLFPFPPLFFVHLFDIGDLGTGDTH